MAVTWDLELDHVGVGVNRTEGILVSAFGLTGLTQSTDYRIRVRAVDTTNSVIVYSPWTDWLDFTTQAAATDITVNLDLITNTQSIHAVTVTVPPVVAITDTYDLRVTEVGVGSNVITGISESNYSLTGLTDGNDYEVEVRLVRSVEGVIYYSPWSDPVSFTAGAAQTNPITVNLGTLLNNQTIYSVTATISNHVGPVSADIGLITNSQTIHSMTVTVQDLGGAVPATHWVVTLIDLSDMSVVSESVTFSSNFSFTGLTIDKNYRVSVLGISQQGGVSNPATVDFATTLETISYYATTITSPDQALDIFSFTVGHVYDTQTATLTISGLATDDIESMTGTFDGVNLNFALNANQYEASLFTGTATLALLMPEELDGGFNIKLTENSILRF